MSNIENVRYIQKVGSAADRDELVSNTKRFIRRKMRELSFLDKILPGDPIEASACQRSTLHDQLEKVIDVEPDSDALVIGWKAGPDFTYISAPRATISFFNITSNMFQKDENELLAYEMPITKVLQDNTIRDMHRAKDAYWTNLCTKATTVSGQSVIAAGATFTKADFVTGLQLIDRQELAVGTVLMAKPKYNELAATSLTDFGSQLIGDVTVNGYRYPTYMGHALVVTTKSDLLTCNPYAPNVVSATSEIQSAVLKFVKTSAAKRVPVDPFYTVGTNLDGLEIGGNGAVYGTYPAANLLNGYWVSGVSTVGYSVTIHTVGGVDPAGGAPTHVTVSADPGVGFTTQKWVGNVIFYFTRPNYLGKHYVLKDVDFWIKQEDFVISWRARMTMGLGLVNVNSVARLIFK